MADRSVSEIIDEALAAAGLDSQSGSVKTVMETIREALSEARVRSSPSPDGGLPVIKTNDCSDK